MELSVGAGAGDAEVELVDAGVGDVDGVIEPLARLYVAEVVSAAGVGGGLNIDPNVGAILSAEVS
jgi:hypothetical protein